MYDRAFFKACPLCASNDVPQERVVNAVQLVKCKACDFVYVNLDDDYIKKQNRALHDSKCASDYKGWQTFVDEFFFRRIAKKIEAAIGRKGRILDVGCGNGQLLKHFIKRRWEAHGVDMSPWAEGFAKKYGYALYPSELEKAGLPSNYFDAVTSTSTIEHISQPRPHVKEILRILRPGGVAFFAGIPNYGSLSVRLNISKFTHNLPPFHTNFFTYKSLHRLFESVEERRHALKIRVGSYGIPEAHRIYTALVGAIRKGAQSDGVYRDNLFKKILATILISLYYYPGKPFHLGDKLEAMIIKF